MLRPTTLPAFAAAAALSAAVLASTHQDIFVTVQRGQIHTGFYDVDNGHIVSGDQRIFAATFGQSGIPNFTNSPGFFALAGTFSVPSQLGFNILAPALVWNGDGFGPTGGEIIRITFSTLSVSTGAGFVTGISLFVQPDGGYHHHFSFFLDPPSGHPALPGIYLLELETVSTMSGTTPSEPLWIIFNYQQTSGVLDAAVAWAQAHLLAPSCPADLDGNHVVNGLDLAVLLGQWTGSVMYSPCPPNKPADFNQDCRINGLDLGSLLGAWGACP